MQREIKFRGKDFSLKGKVVYGVGFLTSMCAYDFLIMEDATFCPIKKHSLSQLIAYDKNGNDVYEGDNVIRIRGDEDFDEEKAFPMAATFEDYGAILKGEIIKCKGK